MLHEYGAAYWRCSLRVSRLIMAYCKSVAAREGWETADLARTLICLGAAFSFLALKETEAKERLSKRIILHRMLGGLDSFLGRPGRRPYASARTGGTELITVRLPQGLSRIISTYANTKGSSMNNVLGMFLEHGLIIYLKGENAMLETVRSLTSESTKGRELKNREGTDHQPWG